ncbi:MAG: hypothetical protein CVT84_16460, partial [Alphaproteobacteria bacterium HGW-Alphaproteobacteria-6]
PAADAGSTPHAQAAGEAAGGAGGRGDRKGPKGPKGHKGGAKGGRERRDDSRGDTPAAQSARRYESRPERKDRIDPDNPFAAALMALRDKI